MHVRCWFVPVLVLVCVVNACLWIGAVVFQFDSCSLVAQVFVVSFRHAQLHSMGGRSFLLISTGHRFVSDSDLDDIIKDIRRLGHSVPSRTDFLLDVSNSLRDPDERGRWRVPPAWASVDTRSSVPVLRVPVR